MLIHFPEEPAIQNWEAVCVRSPSPSPLLSSFRFYTVHGKPFSSPRHWNPTLGAYGPRKRCESGPSSNRLHSPFPGPLWKFHPFLNSHSCPPRSRPSGHNRLQWNPGHHYHNLRRPQTQRLPLLLPNSRRLSRQLSSRDDSWNPIQASGLSDSPDFSAGTRSVPSPSQVPDFCPNTGYNFPWG